MFSGAAIRAMARIVDMGESFVGFVKSASGDLVDHDGDKDAWVQYEDVLTGMPGIARLYIPGNILFAKPTDDDTVMVVRGRDTNGPGQPYMFHGDAGDSTRVPDWWLADTPKDGLFTKRTLRGESKDNDIELVVSASGKKITSTAGTAVHAVNKDGNITSVVATGGTKIEHTAGTTKVTLNKDGSAIFDANGTRITLLNNGNATIDVGSNKLFLGGSSGTEPLPFGTQLRNWLKDEVEDALNKIKSDLQTIAGHTQPLSGTAGPYPLGGSASASPALSAIPTRSAAVPDPPANSTTVESK